MVVMPVFFRYIYIELELRNFEFSRRIGGEKRKPLQASFPVTCSRLSRSVGTLVKEPGNLGIPPGGYPRPKAGYLRFIRNVEKISAPKRSIKIIDHFTCTSAKVIYCRTCTHCKKLYIGKLN